MKSATFPPLAARATFAITTGGAVVYDLVTEQLSTLNQTAAAVAAACANSLDRVSTTTAWTEATGTGRERIESDVDTILGEFEERGWIGSDDFPKLFPHNCRVTPLGSDESFWVQAAGLQRIRWRSVDPSLIDLVHSILNVGPKEAEGLNHTTGNEAAPEPTADFHLIPSDDGVLFKTDSDWPFSSPEAMMRLVVPLVNDWVARTEAEVVMHAAVAVSPSGKVVAISSPAGSGKSTLVAALVQLGWTFVTDESATLLHDDLSIVPYLKPLDLDKNSRAVLSVDFEPEHGDLVPPNALRSATDADRLLATGPVPAPDGVVLVSYIGARDSTADEPVVETLEGVDALVELVRNTLNLRYVGTRGLETLVALAEQTPVHRIAYRSTDEALSQLGTLGLI